MFTSIVVNTYEFQVSKHEYRRFKHFCHGIPEVQIENIYWQQEG